MPVQPAPATPPGAAVFDLDKTLLSTSVSIALAPDLVTTGVMAPRELARGAVSAAIYHRFGASADDLIRARQRVRQMITGVDAVMLAATLRDRVADVVPPLLFAEGLAVVAEHRAAGRPIVIASSSGVEAVSAVADLLGADHVIATRSEVADGRYTGTIEFFAFAEQKAAAVADLAAAEGWDLGASYAYSDSHTDIPLLELVGHPHAVNPDRALRSRAVAAGWPVLEFREAARTSSLGLLQHAAELAAASALREAADAIGPVGRAAGSAAGSAAGLATGVTGRAAGALGGLLRTISGPSDDVG